MPEWLAEWPKTPLIVVIVIAAFTLIWKLGYWMASVNKDRSGIAKALRNFQDEVRKDLREIRSDITKIFRALPPVLVSGRSPVQLTDLGKRVAEDLNAREWAFEHANALRGRAEGLKPYQIYELCEQYVLGELKSRPDNMAECAYEFGTPTESLNAVLIVVLRDELLKRTSQAD